MKKFIYLLVMLLALAGTITAQNYAGPLKSIPWYNNSIPDDRMADW